MKNVLSGLGTLLIFSLSACGGGGGKDLPTATPGDGTGGSGNGGTTQSVAGNYTGTYTTNVVTASTPYSLTLDQSGNTVTGTFASTKISGKVYGTVAANNTIALTITEPRMLGTITATMTPTGSAWALSSLAGTDVFGVHTTGTGTVTKIITPPISVFANGYNGTATITNFSNLTSNPVTTPGGTYPVSITGLLPDGSGCYSGVIANRFAAGILSISYIALASQYTGIIYSGGAQNWVFGYSGGGFLLSDLPSAMMLERLDTGAAYLYSTSMILHPGDITKTLPGTWAYTNPVPTAAGIQSLSATITGVGGLSYTASVTATIRQTVGDPVDTVSGTLQGNYDLNPARDSFTGTRVFQLGLVPTGTLNITNNSGLTTGLGIYLDWVDNSTIPMKSQVSVHSGNKVWPDITMTR
jgi:hypothetical protein